MSDVRVAVLGDVGQRIYHVGDEAMTHAALDALRARGLNEVVVLTRNVELSRVAFGVDTVPTLVFPRPPRERSDYLRRVLAAVEDSASDGLPLLDPALRFIEELRRCDALLVAGGGNMNSLYGWLLYERVAAVRIAQVLGLRVVVSGQTLGPNLYGPDRDAARVLLKAADLIGAREATSLHLMNKLVPALSSTRPCLDDASFFVDEAGGSECESDVGARVGIADVLEGPYIAVTFSPGHGEVDRDAYLTALVDVLDHAVEVTGYPVVFLPHMATPGPEGDSLLHDGRVEHGMDVDELMHYEIATRMGSKKTVLLPVMDAYRTAAFTRQAALVITSRYHPVIFALDGGVPLVALAPEKYSEVRLRGALENWGLGSLALTLPTLFDGTFADAVTDVWNRREDLSSYLRAARPGRLAQHDQWWDKVASVLNGRATSQPTPHFEEHDPPAFDAGWQGRAATSAQLFLPTASALTALRIENEHLRGETTLHREERDRARDELEAWMNSTSLKLARKISAAAAVVRRKK